MLHEKMIHIAPKHLHTDSMVECETIDCNEARSSTPAYEGLRTFAKDRSIGVQGWSCLTEVDNEDAIETEDENEGGLHL